MRKRGQITLFIVLGILILCIVALAIYLVSNVTTERFDNEIYQEPQTPIQRFVVSCMDKVSKDALFRLGQQGGYIYLPEYIENNPALTMGAPPGSPLRVPLWSWQGSRHIPEEELIIDQMQTYMEDNIVLCLQNFTSLRDNVVTIEGEPEFRVRFAENEVLVRMDFPITNTVDDRVQSISEFGTVIPFSLRRVMQTAQKVHEQVMRQQFLGQLTLELMASAEPEIPMSGLQMRCSQPVWRQYLVEERLKEILSYNMPRIRVENTEHQPFLGDDRTYRKYRDMSMKDVESQFCTADGCTRPDDWLSDQFEYNHMYLDADLDRDVEEQRINVGFMYEPVFGMNMGVAPSDDGLMYGSVQENSNDYLDFFCMHVYHFTYDLLYPVQVVVSQQEAFSDGGAFTLRFGIPVALENNIPTTQLGAQALLFPTRFNEDFCEPGPDQVQIYALNAYTSQRVGDVNITYECLKYRCPLGLTRSELNGVLRLTTQLPETCHAGFIVADKQGYVKESIQYGGQPAVELQMTPVVPIYYRVDFAKIGTAPVPLQEGQSATLK